MKRTVSTGAQTQAIPRVPTVDVGAISEAGPPEPAEDACEESVEQLYEAGLAKLHTLHERWRAAVREAQAIEEPGQAAA
jgi:hypothetical protein